MEDKFIARYSRKVIAGEGIWHHGDCHVFSSKICTCGLLHDLAYCLKPELHYGSYYKETAEQDKTIRKLLENEAKCVKLQEQASHLYRGLSWGLDLIDYYDEFLISLGQPKDKILSVLHLNAKEVARKTLKDCVDHALKGLKNERTPG